MPALLRKYLDKFLVGLVVLSVGVLAFMHDGVAAAEVDLNDGGVWVTNGAKNLVGHLNYESQTLEGGLRTASGKFGLTQSGTDVVVESDGLVQPLDTAAVAFMGEAVTTGLRVAHGGDLVLISDPGDGSVWARSVQESATFNAAAEPNLEVKGAAAAVGTDGTGYVVDNEAKVYRVKGSGSDTAAEEIGKLGAPLQQDATLTVAGDTLVALDGHILRTVGRDVDLGDVSGAVVQQPSPGGNEAVVATDTSLIRVDLATGKTSRTDVPSGRPTAPVVLDGCVYGLWGSSGYYVRDCAGNDQDEAAQFPELASLEQPVFRVNRKVIVINDLASGAVFLPRESMIQVDNWDLVSSQLQEQEKEKEEDTTETDQSQLQQFSEEQTPPIANDDEFGARPGTATTLPILLNDVDADGDVLTVVLKDVPDDVSVSIAKDGRAARIEVPGDKVGSVSFTYQASDGIDLSNVAKVQVNIRQAEVNEPPERLRKNTIYVSERAMAQYSVLPDWVDPDGDTVYLENAVGEDGMEVTWRPDGYISVRDLGTGGPGRRSVTVTVSDGRVSTSEELTVQVAAGSSNAPPVANNDHFVANVGETITLTPLSNDTDLEGDELRLAEVGPTGAGVEVKQDLQKNTIEFTASAAGTQVIVYAVTDGPNSSKGKIRIDVTDPAKASPKPAAENDLALLPSNGSVVVEPLLNDYDPAGGLLIIQGVSMGSSEGLSVEVVRHSLLRVTSPTGIKEPQTFEYTVSNGAESTTAKVLVVPLAEKSRIQPPVALPETTVVRVGDIVTVDVLANDYSPSDLAISLSPELDIRSSPDIGEFFVAGDKVRFKAGDKGGTAETIYTVKDSDGNLESSTVSITVRDFDDRNAQPVPRAVEARTFAGMTVQIAVPMDGIDPDGDSVELVGASGPTLGAVKLAGNYLSYTAGDGASGTDSFSYRVKDRFGAEATGSVRVGVAPAPTQNQPPVAVPDEITARPSTRLEIPVTRNDVDPDGDEISIVADSVEAITKGWNPEAKIIGQKVEVLTPETAGIYQLYYRITDGGGSPVTGVVTVTVDEKVPPVAPVAADDYVPVNSIAGLEAVDVDVKINDSDPDGATSELKVEVDSPGVVVGDTVRVPLQSDRQIVLYTVTDKDGLTARAALIVPGKDQIAPYLNPEKAPARVKGGEMLTVAFDEFVVTRNGHTSRLTSVESVVAGAGGDSTSPDLGLKIVDEKTIAFTPDKQFVGETSLTFQVNDGETLEDPRGLTATLSLPIVVESSGLFPPTLRPSEIQVAPGEEPLEASLAAMVEDRDPGDNEKMSYALVSASAAFKAEVQGQNARVSVAADAVPGATGSLVIKVHDGTTDPLEMTVPLKVITSTRPLMTVTDITETDGRVGSPLTWNLNDYVVNPFADRGEELSLVGSPQVAGPATASVSGMNLTVTPTDSGGSSDGAEQVVVTYTVADATKDSSRYRTGVVRVTVKDTPKAPVNVSAEYLKSRTARVTWSHSGWRGGQPKGFLVKWNGGTKDCGRQTSCDIDTLINNNTYSFTVTAQVVESDISDSEPSAVSNAVFVDVAPNPPAAPTPVFGDTKVALTWPVTGVPDGGSPVDKYTVEISPADQSGRTQLTATATTLTWDSLRNGTAYRFRVLAHNKQTALDNRVKPPEGPWSEPVIPAGAPSQQGAPSVVKDKAAAGVEPRATVSWGAPGNPNGDSSFRYQLRMSGGGTVLHEGAEASKVVTMAVGTEDKAFEVRATNKSGLWSEWSPVSNRVRAFQPPGAPTGFSLKATGVANQAQFAFGAAPGNGAKPGEISYRWSAGGASGTVAMGQNVTSSAFANGSSVTVTLTAISAVNGETATGGSVTATVNAYAPPSAPSVSASGNANDVAQSWSMGGISNGRSITSVQLDPGGEVGLSGSRALGSGRNQTHCIRARARNAEGQWGPWSGQACANTWGNPKATEYRGGSTNICGAVGAPCYPYRIRLERWNPNSNVTCSSTGTDGSGTASITVRVDGNGYWDGQFKNWVVKDSVPLGDTTHTCHHS